MFSNITNKKSLNKVQVMNLEGLANTNLTQGSILPSVLVLNKMDLHSSHYEAYAKPFTATCEERKDYAS